MYADPLEYYAKHGLMTDPGKQAFLFSDLPDGISDLSRVVQRSLLHEYWAEQYGYLVPADRALESGIRDMATKLKRVQELVDRPLIESRPVDRRLLGTCRDFALLMTAFLRQKGVPARVRFGFPVYLEADLYQDHVITEYWHADEKRWVLVDPQLDDLQRKAMRITFDPCDIPRELFFSGGEAWQKCRNGELNPHCFGITQKYAGLWYVKGHLARDIAALNKVEMLCWDYWGLFERRDSDLPANDIELLDWAAALSLGGNEAFGELRAVYLQDMRLRVPPVVKSWYVEDEQEYRFEEIIGRDLSLAKYLEI